ncbi:MAG TPA: response regulator transcription factor [Spirochaetia bacterium]|nr:response regulator transcription factor [Spirochaetales bacterium]HRY78789.1 response regulator transcription factor [Spirochaetia bacterium]
MDPIRVHVIDDHALFRRGILEILSKWPEVRSAGESETVDTFLDSPMNQAVDLLLLDLSMGEGLNLDRLPEIRARLPELRVIALTMHNKPVLVKKTVNAGVQGYVVKQSPPEVLRAAVRRVSEGGRYLDPELSESLYQLILDPSRDDASGYAALTPREQEIFRLLAEGLSAELISRKLFISKKTAENHRFRIMQKLGLTSIAELVSYADELGVI